LFLLVRAILQGAVLDVVPICLVVSPPPLVEGDFGCVSCKVQLFIPPRMRDVSAIYIGVGHLFLLPL